MQQLRGHLLARLTAAVDEAGEVSAKLLERSTTPDLLGVTTDEISGGEC